MTECLPDEGCCPCGTDVVIRDGLDLVEAENGEKWYIHPACGRGFRVSSMRQFAAARGVPFKVSL